jgi:uncharacterized protein YecE (DUF72 family)
MPSESMVRNWNRRTPNNFRFTAKFPKIITHDKSFKNIEKEVTVFYERMEPLKDKVSPLLIHYTSSYELQESLEDSSDFFFDGTIMYAIKDIHHGLITWHMIFLKTITFQWSGVNWIY